MNLETINECFQGDGIRTSEIQALREKDLLVKVKLPFNSADFEMMCKVVDFTLTTNGHIVLIAAEEV